MKERVVVGLSGGVDSSVAAYLLQQQGYEVIGLFMQNWHETAGTLSGNCPWEDDIVFAELTARKLDIPFNVVDLSEGYRERVVEYMFREYERGRTPNPDVLCNREVKFDLFMQEAFRLGGEFVATGHYCRKRDDNGMFRLLAGADPNKDQSYFLCQLSQEQLSRALFPIGDLLKPEVRRIAAGQGLATAKRKDSQGICFVGKVDLPVFLQQKLKAQRGEIIEISAAWNGYSQITNYVRAVGESSTSQPLSLEEREANRRGDNYEPYHYLPSDGRVVGSHDGAHFFTIGQRKGLRVGGTAEPLFVIATDVERNIVYVGQGENHPGLMRQALELETPLHWIAPDRAFTQGEHPYQVRIRYRQPLQQATLILNSDRSCIRFDKPQRGISAGQFAAWYDGDELVGSGVIK